VDHEQAAVAVVRFVEAVGVADVDRKIEVGVGIHQLGCNCIEPLWSLTVALLQLRPKIARPPTDRIDLEDLETAGGVLFPDFELRLFLEKRTRMGEYFGIFFCRSSESSSGGSSFVALVGNRLLFSPRHVTGVNPAAKAAVSTSARSTVARIIAVPPTWNLSYLEPVVGGFRKANPDGCRRRRSPSLSSISRPQRRSVSPCRPHRLDAPPPVIE
jgi:hypothetical protein